MNEKRSRNADVWVIGTCINSTYISIFSVLQSFDKLQSPEGIPSS